MSFPVNELALDALISERRRTANGANRPSEDTHDAGYMPAPENEEGYPAGIAIEATEIAKTYKGGVEALKGVTFRVGWGEIFSYLGRNGSGKTTTSRILSTLTNPTSGSAAVAGHDVATEPDAVRRSIGVTMQEAALDNLMTGREHLELVGGLWGLSGKEARRRSDELLEQFGLAGAGMRLISTYSGGMRRRLDIATALISHPRILFLDEPTTGLDPQSRRALWNEIRALKADGASVFLTTQYLEEADELADTVAVINGGTIVACGSPAQLKSSIGRTTIRLRLPDLGQAADLRRVCGETPIEVDDDGRVRIEIHGNATASAAVLDLLGRLRASGVPVEGLSVTEPSLEDAFVRLTGDGLEQSSGLNGVNGSAGAAAAQRSRGAR